MELSTYLFIVLLTAAVLAAIGLWRNMRREKRKNERLSALINTGQIYAITWSTDFRLIEVNESLSQFLKETGMKADEAFLKRLFLDDASIGTTGGVLLMGAMVKTGRKTSFTLPDGTEKHILWKSRIVGAEEACSVVVSTGTDITEKIMLTAQLEDIRHNHAAVNEGLKVAAESADFGILTIRHANHGYVIDISPNGLSILKMKEASFGEFTDKLLPEDRDVFSQTIHRLFRGEMTSADLGVNIRLSEDTVHRFIFRFKTVKSTADDLFRITAAFIDTSEERRHSLATMSENHDPVTVLLKRNCFISEAAEYLQESHSEKLGVAVISIKIDYFRKISTLLGTDTAEKLLNVYARGMEKCSVKPSLFGKMSIDTFAGIIPCENKDAAEKFVKNLSLYIENACNGKMLPEILTGQSRFTAGVCLCNEEDDIVSAYDKAEMALISDFSENGGSCRFFSDEVAMKIYNRDIIEQELRSAVANNELVLYYQPKTDFDGRLYGAEALMRWNHPHNGLISPEAFITIAEECGIITQLDEWGLMQACRQAKKWQEMGFRKIRISVNMSQDQLFKTDVVAFIRNALSTTKLDPSQLEVELTETMAMQDIDRTIEILKEIRSLGVFVSMDDFGTGYSSLSALKLLPVDILKIDRSLICDICISSTSYNIIKAIVEMGNALNLEVLAEGIETEEQSEMLRGLGCHIAQGYFYSKPLSASDMEKMLSEQS